MIGNGRAAIYLGLLMLGGIYSALPYRLGVARGESMEPTIRNGTPFLVDASYYRNHRVERGDIVVFNHGDGMMVKRIVATEGDTLHLWRTSGDGRPEVLKPWELEKVRRMVSRPPWKGALRVEDLKVPPGHVFVLGDNSGVSEDSRTYGPVPVRELAGRVYLPPAVSRLAGGLPTEAGSRG